MTQKSGILIGFIPDIAKNLHLQFSKRIHQKLFLQYTESFIHCDKSKAINIHKHTSYNTNKDNKPCSNINLIKKTYNITPKSRYHPRNKTIKPIVKNNSKNTNSQPNADV